MVFCLMAPPIYILAWSATQLSFVGQWTVLPEDRDSWSHSIEFSMVMGHLARL